MKHLVFAPLYPPVRYGGIEVIAEQLSAAMAATGDVVVLAVTPERSTVQHRRLRSVEVWEVPGHFFSPLAADAANSAALEVARTLAHDVDVVHCHDWFLADAACTVASRGLPLVAHLHTVKALARYQLGEPLTPARRYTEEKQALLVASADVVAVYSDFMRASVAACFQIPIDDLLLFTCGPTLPLERRPPGARRPRGGLRVTYLGRFATEKGVDLLLDAFLHLRRDRGQVCSLRVLGAGPMAPVLIDHAREVPSAEVEFVPMIADPVVLMREYLDSDLVVVPSRFEPYGLVAAEALSLGVPVAVTEVGGLPEVVRWGEFGDVVASNDVDALTEVLETAGSCASSARERADRGMRAHSDPGRWRVAARQVIARAQGASGVAIQ